MTKTERKEYADKLDKMVSAIDDIVAEFQTEAEDASEAKQEAIEAWLDSLQTAYDALSEVSSSLRGA